MTLKVDFVAYTEEFLNLSWLWLNDPEIKLLTLTPDFSREEQLDFFNKIPLRLDYKISGIMVNGERAGACGLKNINNGTAEFWCYLGLKKFWGAGLSVNIIQYIEMQCKDLSVKSLNLKVSSSNFLAIRAYEKNGFSVDSQSSDCILMSKDLL